MVAYEILRRGKSTRLIGGYRSTHAEAYEAVKRLIDIDIALDTYEPFTYCIREIDRGENGNSYICIHSEVII